MDRALQEMFDLDFFRDGGFARKQCPTCSHHYWTLDGDSPDCGDSTCREYGFLGRPLSNRSMSLTEMREAFLSFWENKGHTRVPRNPVVARWRDDIYLNIASIANYQPHVTSGECPPPANPLVVSQPCIRLNDLANIGRSGRHFSCFEMMGHHAFNSPEWGEHYWTEECVSGGHEFLTQVLGIDPLSLTYVESVWAGGGNAGPCVEVFAGGLEVATLVFMCLEQDDGGVFEIKGENYSMMDLRIIDTGWGLERLAWASQGTPSAYETVFPDTLVALRKAAQLKIADDERARQIIAMHAKVQGVLNIDVGMRLDTLRDEVVKRLADHDIETNREELEQIMAPVESLYALADHLRCLSFMVGDGLVPGNVKAGYLMRLMFRRTFRLVQELQIDAPVSQLLADNMTRMAADFPAFASAVDRAVEMADLERTRYDESQARGLRLVERVLVKSKEIDVEQLLDLYDTHGLGPNTVAKAAATKGVTVNIPDDFDILLAQRHSNEKRAKPAKIVPANLAPTQLLFYENQDMQEFEATVIWSGEVDGRDACVLDATAFFWETGGQPADQGQLGDAQVVAMQKDGNHAIHLLSKPLENGATVRGVVDWALRMDHTRSHTATHIMNQCVRRVLGPHSWQAGTQKYADCARVDMSHFRRPNSNELMAIEQLANQVVMQSRPVLPEWWKRNEAEAKWGVTLLQGGIPKGNDVRVVRIGPADGEAEDFDVEYCGGTHCATTSQVGPIKLYRTERIQDGVERFEYAAGPYAVGNWQADRTLLQHASSGLNVSPNELPAASSRMFNEWKEQRKLLEELQKQLAALKADAAAGDAESVAGVRIIVKGDLAPAELQKTAAELVADEATVVLLAAPEGENVRLLFGRSKDVDVDMNSVLQKAAEYVDGRGGGRPDFAQGAGSHAAKTGDALDAAKSLVMDALA